AGSDVTTSASPDAISWRIRLRRPSAVRRKNRECPVSSKAGSPSEWPSHRRLRGSVFGTVTSFFEQRECLLYIPCAGKTGKHCILVGHKQQSDDNVSSLC